MRESDGLRTSRSSSLYVPSRFFSWTVIPRSFVKFKSANDDMYNGIRQVIYDVTDVNIQHSQLER